MKKIRLGIIMMVFCVLCLWQTKQVRAEVITGQCGDDVTYVYDSATETLTISGSGMTYNYSNYDSSPLSNFNCKKVVVENGITSLGNRLFYQGWMESIQLPNSVKHIGIEAFYECRFLKNITIPNGVKRIGYNAFSLCEKLDNVIIANSVTEIGSSAFYGCTSLKKITLPNGLKSIPYGMFSNCTSLYSIIIPQSVKSIGERVFQECSSLDNLIIPDGVTDMGDMVFSNCTSLKNVTLSNNLKSINMYVFYNCTSLSKLIIPNSVTYIGEYAFENCISLSNITIPNNVTYIGEYAFNNCHSLKKLIIGTKVKHIVYNAFENCYNLTSVVIPKSVEQIEGIAFGQCYRLTKVTIKNKKTKIDFMAFCYNAYGNEKAILSNPNLVIYGYKNSTAQKFSNENKIGFQTIGQKQASKSSISTLSSSASGAQVQAKWKKVSNAYQYEVQIYSKANKYGYSQYVRVITKNTSIKLKKNKNLKKGKTYFVRVRAYSKKNGYQIISPWSLVKKLSMKK